MGRGLAPPGGSSDPLPQRILGRPPDAGGHVAPLHELREAYREILSATDRMNCGFLARSRDGRVIYANGRLLSWLGYAPEEVEDKPVAQLFPSEFADELREEMSAIEAGDLRVRLAAVQRKDSTTFPVLIVPQRYHDESHHLAGGFFILVELGAVQTAKQTGYRPGSELRAALDHIALELQSLALSAGTTPAAPVRLSHPELGELSPREREVLVHLVGGARVPSIAEQLHISPHTVRNHLKSIYRKCGVRNQSELIQHVRSLEQ